jgi:c-di-GMP-binding flagellar brake protein YcgR
LQRFPRALFSVPVTLRYLTLGGIRSSPGVSLDISEGGLGAIVQGGLRMGETVEIDVHLPGSGLRAVAVVRYNTHGRCGFEFVGLTQEVRRQIASATGHA